MLIIMKKSCLLQFPEECFAFSFREPFQWFSYCSTIHPNELHDFFSSTDTVVLKKNFINSICFSFQGHNSLHISRVMSVQHFLINCSHVVVSAAYVVAIACDIEHHECFVCSPIEGI